MDEIIMIQMIYDTYISPSCRQAIYKQQNRAFIPLSIFDQDFPWSRLKKFLIDQCLIYEVEPEYLVLSGWTCGR